MKLHIWIAGVVCLTGTWLRAADDKSATPKGDPRAAALMEEAAKTRYTWTQEVTAVSGKFAWVKDGKSGDGTFRSVLRQRGGLKFVSDAEVPTEVSEHIASLINHRTPPAQGGPKRSAAKYVIVVEDDERGPLIMTVGDTMQSTQRVKDGKMVQVNRLMGGKRFTIDVTDFEKSPDGRWCTSAFAVTWWDAATGRRVEKQTHTTQGFHLVEGQIFPMAEQVVSDKVGTAGSLKIRYTDIKFETVGAKVNRR